MELKKFTRQKLEQSAKKSKFFWESVKGRLPKELLDSDDQFQVIDIQEISDDCIDFIMLRKNKDIEIEQLEHCRIVAEKRWFKKPKIKIHFSSGPFTDEFFNGK